MKCTVGIIFSLALILTGCFATPLVEVKPADNKGTPSKEVSAQEAVEEKLPEIRKESNAKEDGVKIEDIDPEEKEKEAKLKIDIDDDDDTTAGFDDIMGHEVITYHGSQLWKVETNEKKTLELLSQLREDDAISMWGGNQSSIDILVKPSALMKVEETFKENNVKFNVIIEDMQKAIVESNPTPSDDFDDRKGHRLTWQSYHRLEDIHGYLNYLNQTYPDLCRVQTIGKSHQGRKINLLKISNGRPGNKAIWVDGGIHAREWITPATVTFIINSIVSNYEQEPQSIQNIDWYFTPVLNPDGYEYSHTVDRLWRKNRRGSGRCAGIDLNRNFGYRWGGRGSGKNPCAETYGGTGPFSEPETAAVQKFITSTGANWKAYVSFHSYGQYILYPWGYDRVVPPDYQDLDSLANKAAQAIRQTGGPQYTVGGAANVLYPASGGSDDWAKGTAGFKYAYTFELRDNGRYGFVLPAAYINPTAREALAAVRVIANAVHNLA